MTKEDKQIIDRAVKEEWRIGDRSRLKRLLKKNLELYRENAELEQDKCELLGIIQGKDKAIKDLQKENAELKSENQKWKDEWQEQAQKATDEGYARTQQTIQLTKAKEHIRTLISCLIDWVQEGDKDYCYIEDAEQFLQEAEKCNM